MQSQQIGRYLVMFDGPNRAQIAADAVRELQQARPDPLNAVKYGRLVASLTAAEVQAMRARGARVLLDHPVSIPPGEAERGRTLPQLQTRPRTTGEPNSFTVQVHGADQLHRAGYFGERTAICIVDTGIDDSHPDIQKIASGDFDNVFTPGPDSPADPQGHGTHCSGSATGTGASGGNTAKLGMAPKARLMGAQVLDENGSGTWSSVMKGIEFAMEKARSGAFPMVVSMSLGGTASKPSADDPLCQMIRKATEELGILFVIAAGNSGPNANTIGTPGIEDTAITVAAFDTKSTVTQADDAPAYFSSRGGSKNADQNDKPNIAANGVNEYSTLPGGKYGRYSGTSMATPNVAGACALLLDMAKDLYDSGKLTKSPKELVSKGLLKQIIYDSANDSPKYDALTEGAGELRVDLAAKLMVERFGK